MNHHTPTAANFQRFCIKQNCTRVCSAGGKRSRRLHAPRDKLSGELSDWIMHIDSYLAQHKELYQVQKQLVNIRKAIAKLRDYLMTEREDKS